jgi:hypothetical protein
MGIGAFRVPVGGRRMETGYLTTNRAESVTLATEPYELATAHRPEAKGIAQIELYIRNKHTREILARINSVDGSSFKIEYKHLDADGQERGGKCKQMQHAFRDFFQNVQDNGYVLMNGTSPPIIRGRLYTSEDPTAKVVIDRFKDSGADGFCVIFRTPAHRERMYEVRYHEGYGVEVSDPHHGDWSHHDQVLAAVADGGKGLQWVAQGGLRERFAIGPFSWEAIKSVVATLEKWRREPL